MATTKDYLPKNDADLLAWTANFAAKINAAPADFGLTAPVAADYLGKQAAFAAALKTATNPDTRGKRTVYLKNQAKKALMTLARQVAKQVTGTMTVTDDQRQELGLPIPKGHRTPTPPPETAPALFATSVDGRIVTLELRQGTGRRGKPAGVASAIVFTASTAVGQNPPAAGDSAWQFAQNTSLTTVQIDCGPSATGDTVHFTAFWCNSKAESGPAAKAISVPLPAGGSITAAQRQTMRLAKAA